MRSGAVRTARLAHNQKVVGSNPTSRTQLASEYRKGFSAPPLWEYVNIAGLT